MIISLSWWASLYARMTSLSITRIELLVPANEWEYNKCVQPLVNESTFNDDFSYLTPLVRGFKPMNKNC